jgi:RimJ/RimL family protein N-acetyltransferase
MAWQLTDDVAAYLAAAGRFLRANATQNTIMLSVAETLQASGPAAFGEAAPLLGWWVQPDGAVGAALLHTPPYPMLLTVLPPGAAAGLAADLAGRGHHPPGVNAAPGPAAEFAAAWAQRTGQASRLGMRMRLYELHRLQPPDPPPPGRARTALDADRDLLLSWLDAFHDEAGPPGPRESQQVVDDRLSFGGLAFWEQAGVPVSLAGRTRPAAGLARIGPVYTPPGLRGRGFGAAVTAAVTQAALDGGAEGVVLFTDLANPASNTLYQRLGYHPVGDWVVLRFGDAAAAPA